MQWCKEDGNLNLKLKERGAKKWQGMAYLEEELEFRLIGWMDLLEDKSSERVETRHYAANHEN